MDSKLSNNALEIETDAITAAMSVIRTNEKYIVAESKSPSPWRPLGSSFLFDDQIVRDHEKSTIINTNETSTLTTTSITTTTSELKKKKNDNNIPDNSNSDNNGNDDTSKRSRMKSNTSSTVPVTSMNTMSSPDSRGNSRGGVSDALDAILDKYKDTTTTDLKNRNHNNSSTAINTTNNNTHMYLSTQLDEFKQVSNTKNTSPLKKPHRSSLDNTGVNKVTNKDLNKSNLLYRMTAIGPRIKRNGSLHIAGKLCNKGLVASRMIKPGECVFSERPLLSVPCNVTPEYLLSSIQFQMSKFTKKHSEDVTILMSLDTTNSAVNSEYSLNAGISIITTDDDASINTRSFIEHESNSVISRGSQPSTTTYILDAMNDNGTITFPDTTTTTPTIPSTPIPPTPGKFPTTPGYSMIPDPIRGRNLYEGKDVTTTASSTASITTWSSFSSPGMLSSASPKTILRNTDSEQRVLEILKEHGVAYADSSKRPGLWGLFPKRSRVRHCCAPNLEIQLHSNGVCTAYASRAIKAGEELTCNLLDDLYETYPIRQQQYCNKFLMFNSENVCCCFVCTQHYPSDEDRRRSVVPHKIATKAVLPLLSLDEGMIGRLIILRRMIDSLEQLIVDDFQRDLFPRDIRQLRDLHVKAASICMKLSETRPKQGTYSEGLRHLTLAGGYSALCIGWSSAETLRITKIINRNHMSACPIHLLPIFAKTEEQHQRWGKENEDKNRTLQQMSMNRGGNKDDPTAHLSSFFNEDYTWDLKLEEFSTYSRSIADGTGTGTSLAASLSGSAAAGEEASCGHISIPGAIVPNNYNMDLNLQQLQLPQMSPLNTPNSLTPRAIRDSDLGATGTRSSKLFVNVDLVGSSQASSAGLETHGDTISEIASHLSEAASLASQTDDMTDII